MKAQGFLIRFLHQVTVGCRVRGLILNVQGLGFTAEGLRYHVSCVLLDVPHSEVDMYVCFHA